MSGGTGGHLFPALALAEQLRRAGHRTSLWTEGRPVEQSLLGRAGCDAVTLRDGGKGLGRIVALPGSTFAARRLLREQHVDAVVGTGGGASVPVGLAARSLGLPLCLLEQNAVIGRANRLLGRLARRIYLGLPVDGLRAEGMRADGQRVEQLATATSPAERSLATDRAPSSSAYSDGEKAILTGTPVRCEFGKIDREAARARLGLDATRPVLLVTGGSQGARVLNELVPAAICELRRPLQIIHLSGDGFDAEVRPRYGPAIDHGVDVIVRPLALDMPELFAAADLVVCRGGGGTISELIAAGRPAVVVPYPHHADRQQFHNARLLERVDAARILEQDALDVPTLVATLGELCADRARLAAMGERALAVAPRGSAASIAADLERIVCA